jgi:hypothetical protein
LGGRGFAVVSAFSFSSALKARRNAAPGFLNPGLAGFVVSFFHPR